VNEPASRLPDGVAASAPVEGESIIIACNDNCNKQKTHGAGHLSLFRNSDLAAEVTKVNLIRVKQVARSGSVPSTYVARLRCGF
jgi:hypothetical protein